jgi:ABC-type multidrug transport system fused ATPase/permease subunit
MDKYRKWLIVSIVFLAAAFVMPVYVLYTALGSTLQHAVDVIPNYSSNNPQTGGIASFLQTQQAAQAQLLVLVIVVEALLIAGFGLTLWYAIKCRDLCRNFPPTPQ